MACDQNQEKTHDLDPARREVLDKLGKLAAYTPPVLLTLLLSQRASAQSIGRPPSPP
jgi:hypothetical protein